MNKEAKHSDAKRPKENQEIIALRLGFFAFPGGFQSS